MKYNKQILNPFDRVYNLPFSASAAAGAGGGKEDPEDYFWFKNEDTKIGYIQLGKNSYSGNFPTLTFEYSTDKENWERFTLTNTNISSQIKTFTDVQPGETYYIRGIGNQKLHASDSKHCGLRISTTNNCKYSIGGNIMSLYDYTRMLEYTEIGEYEFCHFAQSLTILGENLIDCSELHFGNVTTIGVYGCSEMFKYNAALKHAPKMSKITTIGENGCLGMLHGCNDLATPPDMSNVVSIGAYGCSHMLRDCYGLKVGPNISNVISTYRAFPYMFHDCENLQTIYTPNINTYSYDNFTEWLGNDCGAYAPEPKIMYFVNPALMAAMPNDESGSKGYTKQLMQ